MTAEEVKSALGGAARRCWPDVTKASDLPFPEYWKAVTEWLTFHAPHVGDALMWKLIDEFAVRAKEAEESGQKPAVPKVPEEVREIWNKSGSKAEDPVVKTWKEQAWKNAAERAAEVKERFARRPSATQRRFL